MCSGPNQHAYRHSCSTTTALAEICERITSGLDSRDFSHVNVFCLDLSKAFDKLQPRRLLNYLNTRGLNHGFLHWLLSYLSDRTFKVKICNHFGPTIKACSGVPQGSVLGPFLFAAFMGSFSFDKENVYSIMYADDVTLVEHVPCQQVSLISLDYCASLFEKEGLFVNPSKCKQLCFRRTQCGSFDFDCGFERVNQVKILGVIFTDHFSWKAQISNILKLASQRLHIIRCLKSYISAANLMRVYHALITTLFLYASPVYGKLPATLLCKIVSFQRRAHRLVCGPACECDGFPDVERRFEDSAERLLLAAEMNPDHPLHTFVPVRLPSTNKFRLPACNTTRRLNSFFLWAPRVSNSGI